MERSIFRPGKNCWKIKPIKKMALLFDAHAYYHAFFEVANQAERSILIAGWEVDAKVGLHHVAHHFPNNLRDYFNRLTDLHRHLEIYILCWKPALYLRFGRELFANLKWRVQSNPHITFKHDRTPNLFSSYHEKLTIIDDTCAFLGGIDLSKERWDTRDHTFGKPERKDGNGNHYRPVHDIQTVLTGDIIESLEQLYNYRLKGKKTFKRNPPLHEIWPEINGPILENVRAALSRTNPAEEAYEIEQLYIDAISQGRNFILIENQYFTHETITDLLAELLRQEDGPEVIIIMPLSYPGVFEKAIFFKKRDKVIEKLKRADKFKRLEVVYPSLPNEDRVQFIKVHSKLLVVDNKILSIGSANLNHRSMRVDTEINLTIEALADENVEEFICHNVFQLLSEHLDIDVLKFESAYRKSDSLLYSLREFKGAKARTLRDVPKNLLLWYENFLLLLMPFIDIKVAVPKKWLKFIALLLILMVALIFWTTYEP